MFKDKDGHISSTKVMSFCGFFAFLIVSAYCLYVAPDKFDYNLFSILAGGGAVGTRILDKYMNILSNRSNKQKQGVFPPLPEHPPLPIQKGWKMK